jgi:NitT/TauT family transport system permease protein
MKKFLVQINILIIITFVWSIIFDLKIFSPLLLPSPQIIILSLKNIFIEDNVLLDLKYTLWRLFSGLLLGSIFGLIIGFLISLSKKIIELSAFWLDFIRSLPYVALIPIFMLFFGTGDRAKIYLVAFVCFAITILNAVQSLKNINQTRILLAKSLGLNKTQIFSKIILPESLAYLSTGVKHLLSFSIIIVTVSEMFMSTNYGLGKKIINYHLLFSTADMYATIIIIGIVGYILNKIYSLFEKRVLHWVGK